MYYLFHVKNVMPWEYQEQSEGYRDLAWALASYEAEKK